MDLGIKRALAMKKADALQIKGGSSSTPTTKTTQKRKTQGNRGRPSKNGTAATVALSLAVAQDKQDTYRHKVGKGLMSTHGLVPLQFGPQYVPLLVRDMQHAVRMARSLVNESDLDESFEHETELLGDSSLYELIRDEGQALKEEVAALKVEVKRLDGAIRRAKKLTEANVVLTTELASLYESIEKAKANTFGGVQELPGLLQLVGLPIQQRLRGLS
nr:hypothetical protein CFP56_54671 [Quercus suber]